ncbi:hypothetical protein AB0958_37860 [Streptomyces sp. NPDC006655]|uniref:hypothetical protein n=1 Tax=Streptomyces sp. NPDC006655 TaxID=3156898 RepID=UPI003452C5A5
MPGDSDWERFQGGSRLVMIERTRARVKTEVDDVYDCMSDEGVRPRRPHPCIHVLNSATRNVRISTAFSSIEVAHRSDRPVLVQQLKSKLLTADYGAVMFTVIGAKCPSSLEALPKNASTAEQRSSP